MIVILINLAVLLFYVGGVLYYGSKYLLEKSKREELEKQLYGKLTDFEKLQLIAKLYRMTDLTKVNQEQLKDWHKFMVSNKINKETKIDDFLKYAEIARNLKSQ